MSLLKAGHEFRHLLGFSLETKGGQSPVSKELWPPNMSLKKRDLADLLIQVPLTPSPSYSPFCWFSFIPCLLLPLQTSAVRIEATAAAGSTERYL